MADITLAEFIRLQEKKLAQAGVDHPALDAQWLCGHALKLNRTQMLARAREIPSTEEIHTMETLIARRAKREPVARIMGKREFWGLPFGLNEATLEPRPDSEALIEVALKLPSQGRILDLGTGTGCLLLALLHEWPQATGLGLDIAPRAVEQAQKNAERPNLAGRAAFKVNNWLDGITEQFNLIISNPPYIAHEDMAALMPEVRDYDPKAALDGGAEGLEVYRRLIPQLPERLKPGGYVIFEVGQGQANAVAALLKMAAFNNIQKYKDLGGIERCVSAVSI